MAERRTWYQVFHCKLIVVKKNEHKNVLYFFLLEWTSNLNSNFKLICGHHTNYIQIYRDSMWMPDWAAFPLRTRINYELGKYSCRSSVMSCVLLFLISALFCENFTHLLCCRAYISKYFIRAAGSWDLECSEFDPASLKYWVHRVRSDLLANLDSSSTHLCMSCTRTTPCVRSYDSLV